MLQRKKGGGLASDFWSFLAGEGLSYALGAALKPLLPIIAGTSTLVSAVLNHLPLWLLIPFTAVAFAGTLVAVNNVDSFWARRRIKDLVSIFDVQVVEALSNDGLTITGYSVYLIVNNRAEVPVDYSLRDVSGSVDGLALPDLTEATSSGSLEANSHRLHGLGMVPIRADQHDTGRIHIPGKVRLRVDYARSGRKIAQCESIARFDFTVLTDILGYVQRTSARFVRDGY